MSLKNCTLCVRGLRIGNSFNFEWGIKFPRLLESRHLHTLKCLYTHFFLPSPILVFVFSMATVASFSLVLCSRRWRLVSIHPCTSFIRVASRKEGKLDQSASNACDSPTIKEGSGGSGSRCMKKGEDGRAERRGFHVVIAT